MGGSKRRSAKATQHLRRLRERHVAQLAEQRRREQAVDEAAREFVDAQAIINRAEARVQQRIDSLNARIDELRRDCEVTVAEPRGRLAQAVLKMRDEGGCTAEQISELLGVEARAVRDWIARGRELVQRDAVPAEGNLTTTDGDEGERGSESA